MRVLEKLERSRNFWFLLLLGVIFFILRFPSLFEPNWYGDEGVYQALSLAIRNGRLLYLGIWDNKPPILYLVYAFLGSDQFWIKLASLAFGLFAVILFFYLSKKLFQSEKTSLITTSIFGLLLGLPILEGNIANAENFMLLPTIASAFILVNLKESINKKSQQKNILLIFLSGVLLGVSFLFKIVAIFDFGAFFLFLFFIDKSLLDHLKKRRYQTYEVKKLFSYVSGFLILPFLTAAFFFFKGAFSQFISATFFSNIGYVSFGNNLIIPQGLLILKLFLLLSFSELLFLKRKLLGTASVFALLWFSFSLFNAFFSQRPYTHYLLVLLPSFSILVGLLFGKNLQKAYFIFLFLSLILIFKNFSFYTKVLPYYTNFISFVTNNKSFSEYQRFFDQITPVDYELASFIKANTNSSDYIFIWGNNAQLYNLTNRLPPGRYTVAYHIMGSKNGILETTKDLLLKKPKLIIIMPYMNYFPFQLLGYQHRLIIDQAYIYERIL